ncbi:type VI secretion system baseplate subunit TssG [Nitrococcus mobilis]|uniref:Type VI secretion protein, VC_A0111 family n=1 Tax=Nitrococcus mobilis Nb-231 TaxID=314278 RepID=A4BPJ4_9GAMM|nr:type VI secretion system baseplate subunit TssG [Nitrococcus mobilis]EAR22495.1 hypothetical protein NB231_12184 [Nitrococcus mobilis Nb-231]
MSATAELERAPYRFSLFAALRLLEAKHRDSPRLGESRRPADDPVRVAQRPSLRFAPGDVAGFEPGTPNRLSCDSFGLFGPDGALPVHLTEYADERQRQHQDPTFAAFVNMLQHRLACLFYRAWANAQPAVQHDRPEADRFAVYIGALVGIGSPAFRNRDRVGDSARLCRAGRYAPAAKSAEGLEDILADFFGSPCRVIPFQPNWLEMPADERLALGRARGGGLGRAANLGRRSWQCQSNFAIELGPLCRSTFEAFLPGGRRLGELRDLVRAYIGDELRWELILSLRQKEAPPLRLARGARLGRTSWVGRVAGDARGVRVRGNPLEAQPGPDIQKMGRRYRAPGGECRDGNQPYRLVREAR